MRTLLTTLIFVLLTQAAFARSHLQEIKFMTEAKALVEKEVEKYGPSHVMVVFDIDSTLLSQNQDLGADYWFYWQNQKIKNNDPVDRVASSLTELFGIQGQLYYLSKMHATEQFTPDFVQNLQERQVKVMALTSRPPIFKNVTERDLKLGGYDLSKSAPTLEIDSDIYRRGLYLSDGAHKGKTLKKILENNRHLSHLRALIFVDDRPHHATGVADTFSDSDLDVWALRYGHEDARFKAFEETGTAKAATDFKRFQAMKEEFFRPEVQN